MEICEFQLYTTTVHLITTISISPCNHRQDLDFCIINVALATTMPKYICIVYEPGLSIGKFIQFTDKLEKIIPTCKLF